MQCLADASTSVTPCWAGELHWLRVALLYRPGAVSFQDLRTIDGVPCPTFKAAAVALGVLEDDTEHNRCLEEAAVSATAYQMRALFVDILINADVQDPLQLWEAHKLQMVDDFLRDAQQVTACCCSCFCLCLSSCFDLLSCHFFFFFLLLMPFMAEAK